MKKVILIFSSLVVLTSCNDSKVVSLSEEISSLKDQISELEINIDDIRTELNKQRRDLSNLEIDIQYELRNGISDIESDLNSHKFFDH
tara:strand:- start:1001 stop:1264 length:264 start_codon:yes stop_codon:yes gene_type:complete